MQSPLQNLISHAVNLGALLLLVGLWARRRYGVSYSFALYIADILLCESLVMYWPQHFFRWQFWLFKESVYTLLKFAIAMELAARTFRSFPGAQATARRVLFVVLALGYLAILAVPVKGADYGLLAGQVLPRILNATIWLFTAIAVLVLWYRLPVHPLHKAILIGFVPYLLIFSVTMNALDVFGWELRETLGYVHTSAYLLLLLYWCRAAWQRAEAPAMAAAAAREAREPV